MKKNFTKLLIISIICALISVALCYFAVIYSDFGFTATEKVADNFNEMGSDNPGSGWYLLIAGGAAIMADLAMGMTVLIIVIIIPVFVLLVIMVSQCVARLVQIGKQKRWKDITSKIFTYISVVLQILLSLVLVFILLANFPCSKLLLFLALIINIACVIIFIRELQGLRKFKEVEISKK